MDSALINYTGGYTFDSGTTEYELFIPTWKGITDYFLTI